MLNVCLQFACGQEQDTELCRCTMVETVMEWFVLTILPLRMPRLSVESEAMRTAFPCVVRRLDRSPTPLTLPDWRAQEGN